MLQEVLKHIEQRQRFVLTSHARPDGDAIGSALACAQLLQNQGKQADVVLHDPVPRIYQSLPFADRVRQASSVNGNYEAAIILESDSLQRTRLQGLETQFLISIDHHASGRPFAHVNWIDPRCVATGEMVYRMACAARMQITPDIATCLYTALMTDTGSFMFEGTNARTFELARELVQAGADPVHCARNIYFGHSTEKMRLLGAALTNLHREGPFAWIWVTREHMEQCHARPEDCEGLVNYALAIADVEVAVFFREMEDGSYRVSLRSKGKLNVSWIAEHFGGGGHVCASGCSLAGPLTMAVNRVMAQLRMAYPVE
jgi:phosphoesterase RecJ-like protein